MKEKIVIIGIVLMLVSLVGCTESYNYGNDENKPYNPYEGQTGEVLKI